MVMHALPSNSTTVPSMKQWRSTEVAYQNLPVRLALLVLVVEEGVDAISGSRFPSNQLPLETRVRIHARVPLNAAYP